MALIFFSKIIFLTENFMLNLVHASLLQNWSAIGGLEGNILVGPLLFLAYIKDLPNFSNLFRPIMFPDDVI